MPKGMRLCECGDHYAIRSGWCNNCGRGKPSELEIKRRFWAKVKEADENGCLLWGGAVVGRYGRHGHEGRPWAAHRLSYLFMHGEIPEGKLIHHECEQKLCVNPYHLRAVDQREHSVEIHGSFQRAVEASARRNRALTHCKRGHELSGSNLYRHPHNGARECLACRTIRYRERKAGLRGRSK